MRMKQSRVEALACSFSKSSSPPSQLTMQTGFRVCNNRIPFSSRKQHDSRDQAWTERRSQVLRNSARSVFHQGARVSQGLEMNSRTMSLARSSKRLLAGHQYM